MVREAVCHDSLVANGDRFRSFDKGAFCAYFASSAGRGKQESRKQGEGRQGFMGKRRTEEQLSHFYSPSCIPFVHSLERLPSAGENPDSQITRHVTFWRLGTCLGIINHMTCYPVGTCLLISIICGGTTRFQ